MSAAAARRRKQKALKAASGGAEPVSSRLSALLDGDSVDESTAYEALQLAQSQVRRYVKLSQYENAREAAYSVSLKLLEKHGRVSVASQLMTELIKALLETHTVCSDEWVSKFTKLSQAYVSALESSDGMPTTERNRLSRLHLKFLRSALRWSDLCGTVRFGALGMHELVGQHSWKLSLLDDQSFEEEEEEEGVDYNTVGLKCEAVTHLALAEKPLIIGQYLKEQCPDATEEEVAAGHDCAPALRDVLFTRATLVFCSVENLRDAHTLVRYYLDNQCGPLKTEKELKTSYMSKTDGKAPNHAVFNSMLVSICQKDAKTAPLFNWLLRSFTHEFSVMYKPDLLKAYTTRIGRIYFGIQPPPSMLNTIENMMSMMGGGGAGGGMPPINPAMMQSMMASMGGGM